MKKSLLEDIYKYDTDNLDSISAFYKNALLQAENSVRRADADVFSLKGNSEMCLRDVIFTAVKKLQK